MAVRTDIVLWFPGILRWSHYNQIILLTLATFNSPLKGDKVIAWCG